MLQIPRPYALFLGSAPDATTAKTATGVAHWRRDDCVAEIAYEDCAATTGLPRLDVRGAVDAGARTVIVGVANAGGFLEPRWIETLLEAVDAGLDVASGMHVRLSSIEPLRDAAARAGRQLFDVRQPPPSLPVGTGAPRTGRRVLTVGTDCSVGKMYTALAIEREMHARGVDATFRATGQTGILIAGEGICVDAVVADFISGATETLAPAGAPEHWDLIEGQGSLFHPAFAGVSLGLLHGAQAEALVMCHEPTRTRMRGAGHPYPLPDLAACIELNERCARLTCPEARVVGVAVNTAALGEDAARRHLDETAASTGLPSCDPVRTGTGPIVDAILTSSRT